MSRISRGQLQLRVTRTTLAEVIQAAVESTALSIGTAAQNLRVELPEGWTGAATALPPHPDGDALHWRADLDAVIDSPIVLGTPVERAFEVQGVPHRLVTVGEPGPWDADRAAADVETVAEEVAAFWGTVPYRSYAFLAVLAALVAVGFLDQTTPGFVPDFDSQRAQRDSRAELVDAAAGPHHRRHRARRRAWLWRQRG